MWPGCSSLLSAARRSGLHFQPVGSTYQRRGHTGATNLGRPHRGWVQGGKGCGRWCRSVSSELRSPWPCGTRLTGLAVTTARPWALQNAQRTTAVSALLRHSASLKAPEHGVPCRQHCAHRHPPAHAASRTPRLPANDTEILLQRGRRACLNALQRCTGRAVPAAALPFGSAMGRGATSRVYCKRRLKSCRAQRVDVAQGRQFPGTNPDPTRVYTEQ